ncbi:DnaJ C-terminal domain-containing protein [Lysinibacillus xylanilyticus]|uniref:DnaJ C-terminal domain-containing protein n=1 Tax=Lysinibacillus xylanilyticus TaxID=582475 RepID=UPI0036DD8D6E
MTHYITLEIEQNATAEEIKSAYKRLSKIHHPDKPTGDEKIFAEIAKAYNILSDPNERAIYDDGLSKNKAGQPEFRSGANTNVYSNIFAKANDKNAPIRGERRTAKVTISFEEAALGCTKEVTIRVPEKCELCGGKGKIAEEVSVCETCGGSKKIKTEVMNPLGAAVISTRACPDCRGKKSAESVCEECKGVGSKTATLRATVSIPAGVETGNKARVKGFGGKGINGGENGDLIVTISVEDSDTFTRNENNLLFEKEVTFAQLVLGDEVEVPSLTKPVKVKIPKATMPDTKFTFKGFGMPSTEGLKSGDLIVTLKLKIPTDLTEEQEEGLRSLNI